MAVKKISELNVMVAPANEDLLAIVDTSEIDTKKITYANLTKEIRDNIDLIEADVISLDNRLDTAEADIVVLENQHNFVSKYITATAGSNGDFNINIASYTTLTAGLKLNITFPAATVPTANARLSIDNGVTYKNIAPNGFSLKAAQLENNNFVFFYNGTQWTFLKGTYIPIYDQKITNLQNGYGTVNGFRGEANLMNYLNARNQFSGLRIEFNVSANARELAVVESMFYNTSGFLDLTSGRFNGAGTEIALTAARLDVSNTVGITISQFDEILFPSLTKIENSTNFQIVRIFGIV